MSIHLVIIFLIGKGGGGGGGGMDIPAKLC